jgi:hypothetical protein
MLSATEVPIPAPMLFMDGGKVIAFVAQKLRAHDDGVEAPGSSSGHQILRSEVVGDPPLFSYPVVCMKVL